MRSSILAIAVFTFVLGVGDRNQNDLVSSAQAATKSYGCFKVVDASSVRVRKKPYLWSKTLTYVKRGQKIVKNRKFCSIRGTWCRVQVKDVSGWIGKKYIEKTPC